MKKIALLILISFTFYSVNFAQSFPEKCEGVWKGKMQIYNQSKNISSVDIRMTISKIDSLSWTWKTEYISASLPVTKDYVLRIKNLEKGEFLIDEGNGIILNEQLIGNKMISVFDIKGLLLTSSYELIDNKLIFEVISGRKAQSNGANIESYQMKNLQRVVLTKTK